MITQSPDTHPEIEKIQISLIQSLGIAKRTSRVRSLSETTIKLSKRAILRANSGLDKTELNFKFISYYYGEELAVRLRKDMEKKIIMKGSDILEATEPVADAFEKLGVLYYIGGSVASSAYGIPRSTMDVDMVSDLKPEHVRSLVRMLEPSYYIDENMILDAIERRSSFNIIHLGTMIKIDVFVTKNSSYDIETFKRRRKDTLDEDRSSAEFYLVSPEDIILNKLVWFRMGGGVSDRQQNDVLGVLKVQKDSLDEKYLKYWASELGVRDLLEKAFQDSGIRP